MKRRELIRQLERAGCILVRHGSRHDIYRNPATGQQQPVPRHDDVDDDLTQHIKKFLGLQVSYRNSQAF